MGSLSTTKKQLYTLFSMFVAWKGLILLIVFASIGIGYDTSASLLAGAASDAILTDAPAEFSSQWLKFVRWDAIYFTHMADQGHVFEQEWAWGIGLSSSLSFLGQRKIILMQLAHNDTGADSSP